MFSNLGNSCFKEQRTMADRLNETSILFSVKWAHQTWSIQIIDVYLEGNGYFCQHMRTPNGINGFGHGETFSTMEGVQEKVACLLKEAPPVMAPLNSNARALLQSGEDKIETRHMPMLFSVKWTTQEYDVLRIEVYFAVDAYIHRGGVLKDGYDGYLCHYTEHLCCGVMPEGYIMCHTMERAIAHITDMLIGNQPIPAQPNTVAHAMLSITGG